MNLWTKFLGLFLWVVMIYVIGILLFSRGFLLKRVVVEKNSTCETDFTHVDAHGNGGCWMHSSYKKAVVLVIDALRFDFVAKSHEATTLPFHNKLTSVQSVLSRSPKNAKLYKFMADPPTTTMQRIKGLTTGSLPTFVDAGGNFASEEITEDNFIDQFLKIGKNIVFMGDDTWAGLFPNRFKRSYQYPSLNVKDLHTVDNGVLEHLLPEMAKNDWDVLIAHFLGVDHCGHTFGPYHSAMEEKLTQMNSVISDVMSKLDDDTLLVLLGDHGMTRTGDHGGDSPDELEAALFMYSKQQISSTVQDDIATVRQIDLVPTLSLLLGAPIPYSNLGMIIPDLFNYCPWWKDLTPIKQKYHTVEALHINAHQIHQYLATYAEITGEIPRNKYAEQEYLFQTTEEQLQALVTAIAHGENPDTLNKLKQLEADYIKYLEFVRAMCQDIWAKFDLGSMVLGIAAVIKALFLSVYLYNMVESKVELSPQILATMSTSVWAVLLFTFLSVLGLKLAGMIAALVIGIGIIALFGLILYKVIPSNSQPSKAPVKQSSKKLLIFSVGVMMLHNLSLFSNSFVVFEDSTTAFLVQSLAWAMLFVVFLSVQKPTSGKKFDLGRVITSPYFILFSLVLGFCACIRLTANFRACREEQTSPNWTCEVSVFLQPLAALLDTPFRKIRYILSVGMLALLVVSVRLWLRHQGNMNGDAWTVQCVRYALPTMAACTGLYWALLSAPQRVLDRLAPWQMCILPQVAYVLCAVTAITVWLRPLCIFLVHRGDTDNVIPTFSQEDLVSKVYAHMKQNWKQHLGGGGSEKPKPLAYGLASVYSAAVIVLVLTVMLLCALLLGDGLAPTMTLLAFAIFLLLELHAAYCHMQPARSTDQRYDVPFCSVLLLSLLGSAFFFATGHQTTIANIHWLSSYVGFHGDHTIYAIPAFLIATETFSAVIIVGLSLPLLVCWPRVRGRLAYVFEKREEVGTTSELQKQGEFVLNEDYVGLWTAMFRLFMAVLIIHGSKVLCTMLCAALHRRHLMVWKIFAPRFVYEGATFLILCLVCLIDYCFMHRVDRALDRWVEKLDTKSS